MVKDNLQHKIHLISLGCAKNLVDSEVLLGNLKNENFQIVNQPGDAEIIIINTCGFLESARQESIDVIFESAEFKKSGSLKQLVVMGCLSERYTAELRQELPEVDRFFGTHDQAKIISYLTGKSFVRADPDYFRSLLTPSHYAYLKILEGCDNGCSFCSIPLMRGKQVSQSIDWCVNETNRLVNNGVKEVLIIGQDTTSYGWDLQPRGGLHELLDELDKIEDLQWLRLHYTHPAHLHYEVIKRFGRLEKLVPYIDIPIQHSSDRILKQMRRGLGIDGIRKKIDALRQINPDIILRTTFIVGFPGETDREFDELYQFVEKTEFDRLGVFTYSEEEGTSAGDALQDDIPQQVKIDRMDALMLQQQDISLAKNEKLVGKNENILIDSQTDDGLSFGRTYRDSPEVDNLVIINGHHPIGEFIEVKFTAASEYDLEAEVIV